MNDFKTLSLDSHGLEALATTMHTNVEGWLDSYIEYLTGLGLSAADFDHRLGQVTRGVVASTYFTDAMVAANLRDLLEEENQWPMTPVMNTILLSFGDPALLYEFGATMVLIQAAKGLRTGDRDEHVTELKAAIEQLEWDGGQPAISLAECDYLFGLDEDDFWREATLIVVSDAGAMAGMTNAQIFTDDPNMYSTLEWTKYHLEWATAKTLVTIDGVDKSIP